MIVQSDKSFIKDLQKIQDQKTKSQILDLIDELESASNFSLIKNVKKLSGYKKFYRIRIGNYRIGVELNNPEELILIRVLHRKEMYQKWP
jgi:mRNA interferase RelE/StbE